MPSVSVPLSFTFLSVPVSSCAVATPAASNSSTMAVLLMTSSGLEDAIL